MTAPVHILMYHAVSDGAGPTCIAPAAFRAHLDALAVCGYRVVTLAQVAAAWADGQPLGERVAVLTFDDGFTDFADVAYPELAVRGFPATVFLPTDKVGGTADWEGAAGSAARPLMDWATVRMLADLGIEFGSHARRHADLTALTPDEAQAEVVESKQRLEQELGRLVVTFAAPFGRTTPAVRAVISRHYQAAVGTTLGLARPADDRHDLPRLEMHYFRDARRWRSFLEGGSRGYFLLRRALRGFRNFLQGDRPMRPAV